MNIATTPEEWQALRKQIKNKSIGFVPTMGHLHEGHLALCEQSIKENDISVVSIFVNPAQFNQQADLDAYPRTLEADIAKLENIGINYLFAPDQSAMYQDNYEICVSENSISKELEGEYRPGHFEGVLTIVLKLLNLMQADRAYFGEKDYQQLLLIKKMAKALFLSSEIIACETIRAKDGLALSSRNSRLTADQRERAAHFPGLLSSNEDSEIIARQLEALNFKVDYITEKWGRLLGAVWLDDVRLIDNFSREY